MSRMRAVCQGYKLSLELDSDERSLYRKKLIATNTQGGMGVYLKT